MCIRIYGDVLWNEYVSYQIQKTYIDDQKKSKDIMTWYTSRIIYWNIYLYLYLFVFMTYVLINNELVTKDFQIISRSVVLLVDEQYWNLRCMNF